MFSSLIIERNQFTLFTLLKIMKLKIINTETTTSVAYDD